MKIKYIAKWLVCVSCAISLLFSAGCDAAMTNLEKQMIGNNRPSEALLIPDFSNEVTDIRIEFRERDINAGFMGKYEDSVFLQLYYGYCSNGQWYDIPCENYDLKSFSHNMSFGYDAAGDSHIVKIGPYLLVALSANTYDRFEVYGEVEDTFDSDVIEISEYFTPTNPNYSHSGERYVYFKENIRTIDTEDFEYSISNCVNKWYFVVLEYDKLPDDYELAFTIYETLDNDIRDKCFTITYEDIQNKLQAKIIV